MAKKKSESFLTPKGIAMWARIVEPDEQEYAGKKTIAFTMKLRVPVNEAGELIELVDNANQESLAQAKAQLAKMNKKGQITLAAPPYDTVEQDGEEFVEFKFKTKTEFNGKPNKVNLVGADKKELKLTTNPGNGSIMRVRFGIYKWFIPGNKTAGVQLQPWAVQIIDLKEWTGGGDYGFDEEEGSTSGMSEEPDGNTEASDF